MQGNGKVVGKDMSPLAAEPSQTGFDVGLFKLVRSPYW